MPTKNRTRKQLYVRKARAKKAGIPFTITYEDVGDPPDECPCCGQKMERGGRYETANSPSLDRLVGYRGYIPGNVVWLCVSCNRIKQSAGPAELYRLADWLWREYKKRGLLLPATELYPEQERTDDETTATQREGAQHPRRVERQEMDELPRIGDAARSDPRP